MTIEVTDGAQGTVDAVQRMLNQSLPIKERYSSDFDGKAADRWGSTGELGILQQLSLT